MTEPRRVGASLMRAAYRTRLLAEAGRLLAWLIAFWDLFKLVAHLLRYWR